MIQKADKSLIKSFNEIRVLNLIRDEGPVSRTDLSRITQISKVAVYEIIARLTEAGLVTEQGKEAGGKKVGKRPTLVKLNPANHNFLGIEIKRTETRIALANLEATILRMDKITYKAGSPKEQVLNQLFEAIDTLYKRSGVPLENLVAIAIGVPGLIDYEKGRIRFADTLRGWGNRPLAESFIARYGVETFIENDVKLITLGEAIAGAGKNTRNLISIWVGEGMGAGIVVDGNLYKGDAGSAGEIGYLEISETPLSGPRTTYLYSGQKTMGTILSEANLFDAVKRHVPGLELEQPAIGALRAVYEELSEEQHRTIDAILDEYAYYLSVICMMFVTTINPKTIVLCGHVMDTFDCIVQKTQGYIDEKLDVVPFGECKLVTGSLGDTAGMIGAVELALKAVFKSPIGRKARIVEFE